MTAQELYQDYEAFRHSCFDADFIAHLVFGEYMLDDSTIDHQLAQISRSLAGEVESDGEIFLGWFRLRDIVKVRNKLQEYRVIAPDIREEVETLLEAND